VAAALLQAGERLASLAVAVGLETARQEWEEAARQVEAARGDRRRYERLLAQVDVVTDELRRRVGQTFTLAELVRAYGGAEDWAREAVSERAATSGWARDVATVTAAAFHAYQRGASDYAP
jgi:phage shock protein A